MGVLGKDLFDLDRPLTRTKVEFGERTYWVESDRQAIPYGAVLTELLDWDVSAYKKSLSILRETDPATEEYSRRLAETKAELSKLPLYRCYLSKLYSFAGEPDAAFYFQVEKDLDLIHSRYVWFLTALFEKVEPEKKKGQRKLSPAELVANSIVSPLVTGVSLGLSREIDPPPVQVQFAMRGSMDDEEKPELVERMFFDRLIDFVYVELMKGIQKGFLPKRCPNCGKWFLQEPGATYTYCPRPLEKDPNLTCRDVGSLVSFETKRKNNDVWRFHQQAYKKYFARTRAGTMTKTEFEIWSSKAEKLRDAALYEYERAKTKEKIEAIANQLKQDLNRE